MKYKNVHPHEKDYLGRLLQNRVDYNYLSRVAPDQIPVEIKWMWRLITLVIVIVLCILAYYQ